MNRAYFSPVARRDLHEIFDYLSPKNPQAAAELVRKLNQRCRQIADSPRSGTARDDLAVGLRCFPVGRYVVFYRRQDEDVEIARIIHGSRDLGALFP